MNAECIDVWGRGTLNILNMLKFKGLKNPQFYQEGRSFRIHFTRPSVQETTLKTTLKTDEQLLSLVREHPKITREQLAQTLAITIDWLNITRHIRLSPQCGEKSLEN